MSKDLYILHNRQSRRLLLSTRNHSTRGHLLRTEVTHSNEWLPDTFLLGGHF